MSLNLLLTDCSEPFLPDFETGKNDYLVVEGFINVGQKAVTRINLSRVSPLVGSTLEFENDALIFIENEEGDQYPLYLVSDGNYKSDSLSLDATIEHRLIINVDEKQYASDFIKPKITPAIDSIHWQYHDGGVQIRVSSHDPENNTLYYKWNYEETWEYHAQFKSLYVYQGNMVERGTPFMFKLFRCFQTAVPEDLLFASTNHLDEDAVTYTLTHFGNSDRTSVRYSILVEQRALTKDEFDYLQLIQKNSTITGSLFDPMPSEINGNIHSVGNSDEKVIGYIGAYTTSTLRHFITAEEFGFDPVQYCEAVQVGPDEYEEAYGPGGLLIPIDLTMGAPINCMDCKLKGGFTDKPEFW